MFPRNFANLPQPSQQDLQAPPAPPHALGAPPVPGFAPTVPQQWGQQQQQGVPPSQAGGPPVPGFAPTVPAEWAQNQPRKEIPPEMLAYALRNLQGT